MSYRSARIIHSLSLIPALFNAVVILGHIFAGWPLLIPGWLLALSMIVVFFLPFLLAEFVDPQKAKPTPTERAARRARRAQALAETHHALTAILWGLAGWLLIGLVIAWLIVR